MVYAIKHGGSEADLKPHSSAVVVPAQQQHQFLGKLAHGASKRFIQKYQAPRRSSVADAHKALVQRFQLRRVSTGTDGALQHDGSSSQRRSSVLLHSFDLMKQRVPAARPFWQRALKKIKSQGLAAITRLQQPIAPDGKLQQLRELTLLLAFAPQIVYFPFVAVFIKNKSEYSFLGLHVAFESIFIVDLLLAFNTSFYNKDGTQLVVSRVQIAHRYLYSWFLVDLLAAIPFDSIAILSHQRSTGEASGAFVTVLLSRVPKLVHLLSLAPVFTAARALHVTRTFWTWVQYSRYSHLLRIVKLVAGVLATAHYMACAWELIKSPQTHQSIGGDDTMVDETSPFVTYTDNFYLSMLLLQGEAANSNTGTMAQNAYNIGAIMMGSLVLAVVFGNVAMLVSNFYANSSNYQHKMESVFDTMNKMRLPHELRDRIHQYYEHLWREYECLDGDIVNFSKRLTHSLEREVGLFKYMELVVNIPFWKECSPDFITQIVLNLDVRVYLPDDYIIRKGETGEQLFMINKGKCELVQFVKAKSSSMESTGGGGCGGGATSGKPTTSSTSSFQEAVSDSEEEEEEKRRIQAENDAEEEETYYHFRQGKSFGELALLMNYRRTGSVRAVSYVEMSILNRENFQNVLFKYPGDRKKVLLTILEQCIKNNLLKDIPYLWKELVASSRIARTGSPQSRRNAEITMLKSLPGGSQRKFSLSNRRATMFGDNWTVNEVATALADRIDVEHRDESIMFGFQAADIKPREVSSAAHNHHYHQHQQSSPQSQPMSSLDLSNTEARRATLSFTNKTPLGSPQIVPEEATSQTNSFIAAATTVAVPSAPLVPTSEAHPDEKNTDSQTLLETRGLEEESRRKRRRRTPFSVGTAAANETHVQQNAEAVSSLPAQVETMKARLGKAEAVQSKVLHTLSALTESILHLDAFTTDMVVAAASAAAESRVARPRASGSSGAICIFPELASAAAAATSKRSGSRVPPPKIHLRAALEPDETRHDPGDPVDLCDLAAAVFAETPVGRRRAFGERGGERQQLFRALEFLACKAAIITANPLDANLKRTLQEEFFSSHANEPYS